MLYILDKNGTTCQSKSGQKFVNSAVDQILIAGVAKKCERLRNKGHDLAICSNQGGVAFGFMTYREAFLIVNHAAGLIQARFAIFCPHHPNGTNKYGVECTCRKPKLEMLFETMEVLDYQPEDTIFVGDMLTDEQAAEAAGIEFMWADIWLAE